MGDNVIIYADYRYEARVTLRRHRNSETTTLRGTAPVNVATMDDAEAPVALVLHQRKNVHSNRPTTVTTRLRWDGARFLRPLESPDGKPESLESFSERLTGKGMLGDARLGEVEWLDNPLQTFWKDQAGTTRAHSLYRLSRREDKNEIRDWHEDDSEAKAAEMRKRAGSLAVVGGMVYRACPEPTWVVPLFHGAVALDRNAPKPSSAAVRFPLDRLAEAEAFHDTALEVGAHRYPRTDRVEILVPDCLRRSGLAMNARSLFEKVVPELGAMLPNFARGDAARAWADLRDAEHAWRGGAEDAIQDAYEALRRMTEADWTAAPGAKDYQKPNPGTASRFLAAYDTFEAPRLDDLAFASLGM